MKDPIRVKRAVIYLLTNESVGLKITEDTAESIIAEVERFSKLRKIPVITKVDGNVVRLTKGDPNMYLKKVKFEEIHALEVGQSHLFAISTDRERSLRNSVARRNADGTRFYSIKKGPDGFTVTRHALGWGDPLTIAKPAPVSTKYGLEKLATVPKLVLRVSPRDESSLRCLATAKAKREGWTIRCRLQDNGTMLVYRTDPGAVVSAQQTDDATLNDSDSTMKAPSSGDGAVKVSAET